MLPINLHKNVNVLSRKIPFIIEYNYDKNEYQKYKKLIKNCLFSFKTDQHFTDNLLWYFLQITEISKCDSFIFLIPCDGV